MSAASSREVLLDTSPLVALLNADDRRHAQAVETLSRLGTARLVTCEAVVTEASYLLRRPTKQAQLHRWLDAAKVDVRAPGAEARPELAALILRYADLPMDYADAVLVHLALVAGITRIWTYDGRDFSVYRVRGRALQIVE